MTAPGSKRPFTWRDYEHGRSSPRQGSTGSTSSRVHFDEPSSAAESSRVEIPHGNYGINDESDEGLRRRRYLSNTYFCADIDANTLLRNADHPSPWA